MRQEQRSEETRARILEAAQLCIGERGYDATSVIEICRRAGVSKGAFYHHFASKQAAFLELLNRWLMALDAQMASLSGDSASVPERLLRMAAVLPQVLASGSGRLPIFVEFWAQAARDPDMWRATIAPYRRYAAFFCSLVEAGVAEGSLQCEDPQVAARAILSLAVGLVLQGLLDPQGADWGRVAQEGLRSILCGIGGSR